MVSAFCDFGLSYRTQTQSNDVFRINIARVEKKLNPSTDNIEDSINPWGC